MWKILIVDDDEALSDITREMLESYGYEVFKAGSAEEAFALLTDNRYDLIILDITLIINFLLTPLTIDFLDLFFTFFLISSDHNSGQNLNSMIQNIIFLIC